MLLQLHVKLDYIALCPRQSWGQMSPGPWLRPFYKFLINPLWIPSIVKYCVRRWWNPPQLPSFQGSWLWLLQIHWGSVRSRHIAYYSSCYLHKICHNFFIKQHQLRQNCCHHKPNFTLIWPNPMLRPTPAGGAYSAPPAGFEGPYF